MARVFFPMMSLSRALDTSRLDTLPTDILLIILGYLDTAQSVAHLSAVSKRLHQLISVEGWRIFVKSCFSSLTLPTSNSDENWAVLARVLTSQSRDWDRRAFVSHSLSPPKTRRNYPAQTIPGNIIVDAHLWRQGRLDEELVIWGCGEDIVARIRTNDRTKVVSESWHCYKGSESSFVAGKDDTTAISIVKSNSLRGKEDMGVIVGRANGDLRLLSIGASSPGQTLIHFCPPPPSSVHQHEIQAVDICSDSSTMAAGTRESVWLYSLQNHGRTNSNDVSEPPRTDPAVAVSLRDSQQFSSFDFIRSVRMMGKETIAVALNRSFDPIRVLDVTPTGVETSAPARILNENLYMGSCPRTVRTLLPVDVRSIASGGGNVLLSSWNDGTIRLKDLRSPSSVDRVYQDHFEFGTPINALISYGLERFVAGSAFSQILKVFDFRWPRGYYHTDALPCTNINPYPTPISPTLVDEPKYHDDRPLCDHILGRLCRWHALSRHGFYRPNCNIYPPLPNDAISPIYSLAKPSDVSPTIYAGLSGVLVEFTLKSGIHNAIVPNANALYTRKRGKVAILESGDGSAISDVSQCQGVPKLRRQSFSNADYDSTWARRQHRLDEALQDPHEWQAIQGSSFMKVLKQRILPFI